MKQDIPDLNNFFDGKSSLFPANVEDEKVEPVKEKVKKLHTYKHRNVAMRKHRYVGTNKQTNEAMNKQANIAMNEQVNEQIDEPINIRLLDYLNIYSFKATREQVKKDTHTATNVEISDELRKAMDKLMNIYKDGVVANDDDRNYKQIINNALFDYLTKCYKRLNENKQ